MKPKAKEQGKIYLVKAIEDLEKNQKKSEERKAQRLEKLKEGKLEKSKSGLLLYAEYLNDHFKFPIKASYMDNSDMFGSMEYHVEIISIHEKVKTLEKGVHSKCKYGGKIIHVPLHILQFKSTSKHNTILLQKYLEWFKK